MLFNKEARNCIDVCVDTAFEVVNAVNTFLFCTNDVYEEFSNINSRFNQTYQKDFKNKALILYGLDTFKTRLNESVEHEYDLSFKDETLKELLKFSIALENPNYAKENTFVRS